MKNTITEQLTEICELHHDKQFVAFHHENKISEIITFGELLKRALQYSNILKKKSTTKGSTIVILMNLCPDVFYAFIGSIFAGCIPSIFAINPSKQDPILFRQSMESLISISEAKLVITSKEHFENLKSLNLKADIFESPLELSNHTPTEKIEPPDPDDIAFLQHSSGTTGLKKGVALTHRQVINQILHLSDSINLNNQDRIAAWVPLYHDMGLIASVILPLLTGTPLEIMDPFEWVTKPHLLLNVISKTKATICWQPNFAYVFLSDRVQAKKIEDVNLSSIRAFISCGEPITAYAHEKFLERFKDYGVTPKSLCTMYAMAENVFVVSAGGFNKPVKTIIADLNLFQEKGLIQQSKNGKSFVSSGQIVQNCEVKIVNDSGNKSPDGTVGEIYIRSDCLFKEYLHRPEETEKAFQDEWYKSGDLGFIIEDDLFVIGRKKDMIIIAGKNIYPQDIEDIVSVIPGVHPGRVTVFGNFNERKGTQDLVILIEPESDKKEDHIILEKEIRKRVAQLSESVVDHIKFVPRMWLIKSTSGKISRSQSREKWLTDRTIHKEDN